MGDGRDQRPDNVDRKLWNLIGYCNWVAVADCIEELGHDIRLAGGSPCKEKMTGSAHILL